MTRSVVHRGDCLETLRTLPAESVDSVVTDPPAGIGFMGKEWDDDKGGRDAWIAWLESVMRECLRTLKPGGHALVWAIPRTSHWTATAIENAGFEVRDVISHVFGTGFPKSLDVSKAIDKQRVEDVEPVRVVCRAIRAAMDAKGLKSRHLVEHFDNCHSRLIDHWAARDTDSQPALPTWPQWLKLRDVLEMSDTLDAEVWRLNGRKGKPGEAWQNAEVVGVKKNAMSGWDVDGGTKFVDREEKKPATDAAKRWSGWGTALKPASEHWILARKPLSGTVAANVQRYGVGAINVDACRIATASEDLDAMRGRSGGHATYGADDTNTALGKGLGQPLGKIWEPKSEGRWPANLILSHAPACDAVCDASCPVAAMDVQAGERVSGSRKAGARKVGMGYHGAEGDGGPEIVGSSGGASRFFYVAKPSKSERNAGSVENVHPTVKPIELMRYLCRLVTPPGGTVLDPFVGSGTTGCAATLEGFSFIGCEQSPEYAKIAEARIAHWQTKAPVVDPLEAFKRSLGLA